jgi:hypothetical protein
MGIRTRTHVRRHVQEEVVELGDDHVAADFAVLGVP